MKRAQQSMQDESIHSYCHANPLIGSQARPADPDIYLAPAQQQSYRQASGSGAAADPLEIWRMLPALKDLPVALLQQLPRSKIFQLNAALVKENKSASRIQTNAKLMMNAQQLEKNPVQVEPGYDDRKRVLHKARFLGGASCTAQKLWF
jgi:hypothetical protein